MRGEIELELYFCNIVTHTRLYQFVALYDSIIKQTSQCRLFTLCMDTETTRILKKMNLQNVTLYTLEELENESLLTVKGERTIDEYCWTLKPVFLSYVFENHESIDKLIYLDADTYFYANPELIFNEVYAWSVLLSPHDFMEEIKDIERDVGKYNAGLICFQRNSNGMKALEWWREKCFDWCHKTTVTGQFGDQKYLEEMKHHFKGIKTIRTPGVNMAPWNDAKYLIHVLDGKLFADENRIVLYHYCGFRVYKKNSCLFMFGDTLIPVIHEPYIKAVKDAIQKVEIVEPDYDGSFLEDENHGRFKTFEL